MSLNVTFATSAAGSLKFAFDKLKRDEEVVFLTDDLSYGPIDPPDSKSRNKWFAEMVSAHPSEINVVPTDNFWDAIVEAKSDIVLWLSSRCLREYCGFLEVLSRLPDAILSVVDVAEVSFVDRGALVPETSKSFAWVNETQIVDQKLVERAVRLTSRARDGYLAEWSRMRSENAPVRILTEGGVVSAPVTYYDNIIRSFVTDEWQSSSRVVGRALIRASEGRFRQISSDTFLFGRVLAMIDSGVIEGTKEMELWTMHHSKIRLTQTAG